MKTSLECLLIAVIGRVLFEAATAQTPTPVTPADVFARVVENQGHHWTEPTPIPSPTPTPVFK